MSDPVAIALVTAVPAAILALATLWSSVKNGRKADRLEVKTDEIHAQTNGTLSKLTEQLRTANDTIDRMHKSIETIVPPKKTKGS